MNKAKHFPKVIVFLPVLAMSTKFDDIGINKTNIMIDRNASPSYNFESFLLIDQCIIRSSHSNYFSV